MGLNAYLHGQLLKLTAAEIAPYLTRLFNLSLKLGKMPVLCEAGKHQSYPQKGDSYLVKNYRPISLVCLVSKVMEKCIYICIAMISYLRHFLICNMAFNGGKIVQHNSYMSITTFISALNKKLETQWSIWIFLKPSIKSPRNYFYTN